MKYKVTAQELDRHTGKIMGPVRDEIIDTETNVLFRTIAATSPTDKLLAVKRIYESFWNELTTSETNGVVFVQRVVPC